MAVYRRSRRHRFLLVLLLLTSVTVITLDQRGQGSDALESARSTARDAFGSVENATNDAFAPVGDFFSGVFDYGDLKAENRRLRAQLDQVRSKDVLAEETDRELRVVKENEHLEFAAQIPAVAAQVVTTSPSNFQLWLTVVVRLWKSPWNQATDTDSRGNSSCCSSSPCSRFHVRG